MGTISSLFLVESMQNVPGNRHFQGTVEFGTLINFYFENKYLHLLGQFILFSALQGLNVANIVLTIQQFDTLIMAIFRKNCGIAFTPNPLSVNPMLNATSPAFCIGMDALQSVANMGTPPSPFGDVPMFLTLGTLVALCIVFPLGTLNLDDNIWSQIGMPGASSIVFRDHVMTSVNNLGAVIITVIIVIQWLITFFINGLNVALPAFGPSIPAAPGLAMTNFGFIITVPSWINVKQKHVPVTTSIWSATGGATVVYILVGVFGALTFENVPSLLTALASQVPGTLGTVSRIFGYMFTLSVLMASIPVACIVARNNLVQNEILSYRVATFFSHVLPWLVSLPMQTGTIVSTWTNWIGLIFISTANFIIPFLIYLRATSFRDRYEKGQQSIHRYIDRLDRRSRRKSDKPRLDKFFSDVNFNEILTKTNAKVDYGDGWDPDAEEVAPFGVSSNLIPASEHGSASSSNTTITSLVSGSASKVLDAAGLPDIPKGSSRDGYSMLEENDTTVSGIGHDPSKLSIGRTTGRRSSLISPGATSRWRRDILDDVKQPGAGLVPRSVTRRWGMSSAQSETVLAELERGGEGAARKMRPSFLAPVTLPSDDDDEVSDDDGDLTWSNYGEKQAKEDVADIAKGYLAANPTPPPSERPRGLLDRSMTRSKSLDSVRLSGEEEMMRGERTSLDSPVALTVRGSKDMDARQVRFDSIAPKDEKSRTFLPLGLATQADSGPQAEERNDDSLGRTSRSNKSTTSSTPLLLAPERRHAEMESDSEDERPARGLARTKTLPTEPNFVSPAFQALPSWWRVRPRTVAFSFLTFLSILIFATTVYSFVLLGLGRNPFGA
ncbi:hypothetical protein HDU93_008898 [Gonapodya sp. JEL0774]|nr:hypothetical protein HDU93_008898 [Gonapodya sp. JEL0774]